MPSRDLVDAVAHARRDLAEPVRVHLDAGGLHLREHAHERQLDLAEQPLEAELDEARPLRLGHAPREERRAWPRRPRPPAPRRARAPSSAPASANRRALLLRPLRREQVGGHGGVEGRARRRVREARAAPWRRAPRRAPPAARASRPACVGRRRQARPRRRRARPPTRPASSPSPRGSKASAASPFSSSGGQRPDVRLRREPHQRAAHAGRRRAAACGRVRGAGDLVQATPQGAELVALEDAVDLLDRQAVAAGGDQLDEVVLERHVAAPSWPAACERRAASSCSPAARAACPT